MDSDDEARINGEKPKPSIPPWAKANGRGKFNYCFFMIMLDLTVKTHQLVLPLLLPLR